MLISKNGKRFMAWIMAMVFVLAGLAYVPKTAAAEEISPSVEVLGATLRLSSEKDNSGGKQSMRVGIQITNASQAKDCAIELKVDGGSKSYTIGTSNYPNVDKAGDYLNSINKASDTIIYSVVITDIPKDAFDTNVSILGHVINMDGSDIKSDNGTPVSKNVNGVVDEIKAKFPGIELIDGILVKPYASMTVKEAGLSQKDDMINNNEPTFQYWNDEGKGDSVSCDASYEYLEAGDTKYYSVRSDSSTGKGVGFQRFEEGANYIASAELKLTKPGDEVKVDLVEYYEHYNPDSKSIISLTSEWAKYKFTINSAAAFNQFSITTGSPSQNYDIKSFDIYKILTTADFNGYSDKYNVEPSFPKDAYVLPLEDANIDGYGFDKMPNADGSITFNYREQYAEAQFKIPDTVDVEKERFDTVIIHLKDYVPNDGNKIWDFKFKAGDDTADNFRDLSSIISGSWGGSYNDAITIVNSGKDVFTNVLGLMNTNAGSAEITIAGIAFLRTNPLPDRLEGAEKLAEGTEIAIDGVADEAYADVAEQPIDSRAVTDNKGDSTTTATAKVVWDPNNLYVLVNVKDENIDATAKDDYRQDGVEIFLDEDNSREIGWDNNTDAFQYRLTGLTKDEAGKAKDPITSKFAAGKGVDGNNGVKPEYAKLEAKYAFTDEGYAVEFKVPFMNEKADGDVVGFDIIVQDCKNGGRDAEIYYSETTAGKSYWNLGEVFAELPLLGDA